MSIPPRRALLRLWEGNDMLKLLSVALLAASMGAPLMAAESSAPDSSDTSVVSSSPETTSDITDEEESKLDELIEAITSSSWWKGILTALIAWLTANAGALIGLAIGLVKSRTKQALQNATYQNDVKLIAEKFSANQELLEKKLDEKLDAMTEKCVKVLKESGNEKAAAELLVGYSSSEKVEKALAETAAEQADKGE